MSSIKIHNLKDPTADQADTAFWSQQSTSFKLLVLEQIRRNWIKMNPENHKDGDFERLRRILRIAQRA